MDNWFGVWSMYIESITMHKHLESLKLKLMKKGLKCLMGHINSLK